jgi:hypothetical protein
VYQGDNTNHPQHNICNNQNSAVGDIWLERALPFSSLAKRQEVRILLKHGSLNGVSHLDCRKFKYFHNEVYWFLHTGFNDYKKS